MAFSHVMHWRDYHMTKTWPIIFTECDLWCSRYQVFIIVCGAWWLWKCSWKREVFTDFLICTISSLIEECDECACLRPMSCSSDRHWAGERNMPLGAAKNFLIDEVSVNILALPKFGSEPQFEPEPSGPNAKFGSSSGSGSGSRKFLENRFGLNRTSKPFATGEHTFPLFSTFFLEFFSSKLL